MAENPDGSVLQWTLSGGAVVKLESGVSGVSGVTSAAAAAGVNTLSPSQSAELHFLRARVRELEREKAELAAENHRLKNMLVHEIPGLLSTMWQTLGQGNTQPYVSAATGRADSYGAYLHPHHAVSNPDGELSPGVHLQPRSADELAADLSDFCVPLDPGEEEGGPGGAEVGSHMGEEAPLCSQTNMEELRRSCSESQCAAADTKDHVSQVEVYPGSGVLCDVRSWHAANQAPSPTAMARTLLMGVFDMNTLMNSNLRGGHSRRPASHSQRSALDPRKINAIFNAILARFPLARKGVIGSGINSKLSEIRFRSRKANRDPRFL